MLIATGHEEHHAAQLRAAHDGHVLARDGFDADNVELKQRWLLAMRHAAACVQSRAGPCHEVDKCKYARLMWHHVSNCKDGGCMFPRCLEVKAVLQHHAHCKSMSCKVCMPVKAYVYHSSLSGGKRPPGSEPKGLPEHSDMGGGRSGANGASPMEGTMDGFPHEHNIAAAAAAAAVAAVTGSNPAGSHVGADAAALRAMAATSSGQPMHQHPHQLMQQQQQQARAPTAAEVFARQQQQMQQQGLRLASSAPPEGSYGAILNSHAMRPTNSSGMAGPSSTGTVGTTHQAPPSGPLSQQQLQNGHMRVGPASASVAAAHSSGHKQPSPSASGPDQQAMSTYHPQHQQQQQLTSASSGQAGPHGGIHASMMTAQGQSGPTSQMQLSGMAVLPSLPPGPGTMPMGASYPVRTGPMAVSSASAANTAAWCMAGLAVASSQQAHAGSYGSHGMGPMGAAAAVGGPASVGGPNSTGSLGHPMPSVGAGMGVPLSAAPMGTAEQHLAAAHALLQQEQARLAMGGAPSGGAPVSGPHQQQTLLHQHAFLQQLQQQQQQQALLVQQAAIRHAQAHAQAQHAGLYGGGLAPGAGMGVPGAGSMGVGSMAAMRQLQGTGTMGPGGTM